MNAKYWIVASQSHGPSHWPYRHQTQALALAEATRLVKEHGGCFIVLEAQVAVEKNDVIIRRLDEDHPF